MSKIYKQIYKHKFSNTDFTVPQSNQVSIFPENRHDAAQNVMCNGVQIFCSVSKTFCHIYYEDKGRRCISAIQFSHHYRYFNLMGDRLVKQITKAKKAGNVLSCEAKQKRTKQEGKPRGISVQKRLTYNFLWVLPSSLGKVAINRHRSRN